LVEPVTSFENSWNTGGITRYRIARVTLDVLIYPDFTCCTWYQTTGILAPILSGEAELRLQMALP